MWYEDAVRRPADSGRQRALSGYSDQRLDSRERAKRP